ncbi:MAG: LPS translocon maturation chaperone LptM [Candidatus Comchoanobacterales bacterium]
MGDRYYECMERIMMRYWVTLIIVLGCSGCGITGDLYLPKEQSDIIS